MTGVQWEQLSNLLTEVADLPLRTWKEKKECLEQNLTPSGRAALQEVVGWFD